MLSLQNSKLFWWDDEVQNYFGGMTKFRHPTKMQSKNSAGYINEKHALSYENGQKLTEFQKIV